MKTSFRLSYQELAPVSEVEAKCYSSHNIMQPPEPLEMAHDVDRLAIVADEETFVVFSLGSTRRKLVPVRAGLNYFYWCDWEMFIRQDQLKGKASSSDYGLSVASSDLRVAPLKGYVLLDPAVNPMSGLLPPSCFSQNFKGVHQAYYLCAEGAQVTNLQRCRLETGPLVIGSPLPIDMMPEVLDKPVQLPQGVVTLPVRQASWAEVMVRTSHIRLCCLPIKMRTNVPCGRLLIC